MEPNKEEYYPESLENAPGSEPYSVWAEIKKKDANIIKIFSEDKTIPDGIRKMLWGFFAPRIIWSNMTKKDLYRQKEMILYQLDTWKASMPFYEQNFDMERLEINILAAFESQITRAVGENRERILISKDVKETHEMITNMQRSGQGNILSRSARRLMGR